MSAPGAFTIQVESPARAGGCWLRRGVPRTTITAPAAERLAGGVTRRIAAKLLLDVLGGVFNHR